MTKEVKKTGKKTGKDYKVGKGKPPKDKQFTKENQPSPEAKSKGRDRKRKAKEMMDRIEEIQHLSLSELEVYVQEIGQDMKIGESILVSYIQDILKSPKARQDWMDRHISKAPTQITGEGDKDFIPTEIKITIEK